MVKDVYKIVRRCGQCPQNKPSDKRHWPLQLSLASGPLELVTGDILGALPKTLNGLEYVLVMSDRYSKVTIAISTSKSMEPDILCPFMDNWTKPCSILTPVLTDNGVHFVSKFFASL